ncbi:DUF4148 domain-containing protein [Paraburkholderia caledonica]|jgi:hypothetical protein|uniref:DUF4148 domain-containing protein n=1 Tax=Paraburkholderia caledonica TaxID=134536 RepID=UPI000482F749|nr:DUF4148 domain-containing protein [Paraburkholderia caledonica]AXF19011.1 DUF4148 domain-containing protein [Paraburkholderia caledonica]
MKSLIHAVIAAAVFAAPAVSFAQQSDPPVTTRAQVRAELIQLENAGYHPAVANDATYPTEIQAAEARVAAQNGTASGYGGRISGSVASGAPVMVRPSTDDGMKSLYFGN